MNNFYTKKDKFPSNAVTAQYLIDYLNNLRLPKDITLDDVVIGIRAVNDNKESRIIPCFKTQLVCSLNGLVITVLNVNIKTHKRTIKEEIIKTSKIIDDYIDNNGRKIL
jgi:hypothetical protein